MRRAIVCGNRWTRTSRRSLGKQVNSPRNLLSARRLSGQLLVDFW